MRSPYSDPRLSLRARGLYALYIETGRVLTSAEISSAVPEGRDAVRSAMTELKTFRYIKAVKHQIKGKWTTVLKFTDDGISGVGNPGVLYNTSISNLSTSDNNYRVLEVVTNVTTSNTRETQKKEGVQMGWPIIDEPELPKPKFRVTSKTDDEIGSVGKVEDKKAMRNLKYKKTNFEALPKHMRRNERPEELWSTEDLIAEFYDLVRLSAPGAPGQMNYKYMQSWINKQVGSGTERVAILKAIRMFFEDTRVTRDPGVGQPMWRRFIAYYSTIHGIVTRVANPVYNDEAFLLHQEKMLKLLEG